MQYVDGQLIFSATDLNNFLECRRLTELEDLVARGLTQAPADDDEQAKLVRRKGDEHERAFLARLEERHGDGLVSMPRCARSVEAYRQAEAQTLEAMRAGAPVIYQATLFDGQFLGHADFLRRVETPSDLGAWSYEVLDTKLALSSKPYFLIQLCNYSEHLARLQGAAPRHGHIILGNNEEQSFLIHDYEAYYRHLKNEFLAFAERSSRSVASEYPLPRKHCKICPWSEACTRQRVDDDHLSIVAWMRRDQIAKFENAGITTVARLAHASEDERPLGMNADTFVKLRRQAALQEQGKHGGLHFELVRHDPRAGFGILPRPSEGDIYFDMEGDPLYEPGRSLEYLFGAWTLDEPHYHAFWGLDRTEEKRALEAFVDFVMERRRRFPNLHVYHYANYEKAALRRLAQAHATREAEVDELLRGEVLVDLFAVVRQAVAISEDSYSIKRLEKFYHLKRSTTVKKGDDSIVMFERWLHERDDSILRDIEAYNRDDCYSTLLLRDWLLARREQAELEHATEYPFRELKTAQEAPARDESLERYASELEAGLLTDLPAIDEHSFSTAAEETRLRYLLGHALSYHRREDKPVWWAFFDRCDNVDDLLEFDREAIAGLQFDESVPPRTDKKSTIFTYRMPEQRYKLAAGDAVCDPYTAKGAGTIVSVDEDRGLLELKTTKGEAYARGIRALIPGGPLSSNEQRRSIASVAEGLVRGTLRHEYPAIADLLAAALPRVRGIDRGDSLQPKTVTADAVSRIVQGLDRSYLFIQGPPGSGKTTICSSVIADLLQSGARVGVVSTGHKAIHHLLHKVEMRMHERGAAFRGLYKHSANSGHSEYVSPLQHASIVSTGDNKAFAGSDYELAGGTAWLFSRPELRGAFDYLFIDEAGQVSLADAIAVAACAKNLVLLGDPAQLAQVSQGSHPYRAGWSVLEHVLDQEPTIGPDRGIFLDVSYRMQPDICEFISLAMYDGRLSPAPSTVHHAVRSGGLSGGGLRYIPITHTVNSASSVEEADCIVREITLLRDGFVTDDDGIERPLRDHDIIVVTPYNAQRRLIERRLRDAGLHVAVGTVDKFQGQEAAVVFYSMATSSGDDVPRDVAFLFEQNRFNVAVSRARAMSVLVCSPRLLDVSCNSPQQMAMINFVCAYVERSTSAAEDSYTRS